MHWLGGAFGIWGGLALLGAWIAGESGTVLGFSQQRLYSDAVVLTLISIAALICTLVYLKQGKK